VERSLANRSARNVLPFSTEAMRRPGCRSKSFSNAIVMRKSNAARSIANDLIEGFHPPP
jgi:hypothetical protein